MDDILAKILLGWALSNIVYRIVYEKLCFPTLQFIEVCWFIVIRIFTTLKNHLLDEPARAALSASELNAFN